MKITTDKVAKINQQLYDALYYSLVYYCKIHWAISDHLSEYAMWYSFDDCLILARHLEYLGRRNNRTTCYGHDHVADNAHEIFLLTKKQSDAIYKVARVAIHGKEGITPSDFIGLGRSNYLTGTNGKSVLRNSKLVREMIC